MPTRNEQLPPADGGPVERPLGLEPERAAFEAFCVRRWRGDRNALGRNAEDHPKHPSEYTIGNVEFAWQAWLASRAACASVCDDAVQRYYSGGFHEAAGACLHLGSQLRPNG